MAYGSSISIVYNAKVRESTQIDFPIFEYTLSRNFVEMIHPRIPDVRRKPAYKHGSFVFIDKSGCFRPVGDPPFGYDTHKHCQTTFQNEDPDQRNMSLICKWLVL